jgi:complement component 1 Q subcomponent-binding protein
MRGKFGDAESIKIEATMFDGCVPVPRLGDDSSGADMRLHLSLLVDISRDDCGDELEFLCSAWPDLLEVQKVYTLRRDRMLARPYMGPDFR